MIVQACINGARPVDFHPHLPLTAAAMATDGAACIAAGAAELHIHPRGTDGRESLAAVDETMAAVRRACPGTFIGVSTGAWIENEAQRTRRAIDGWRRLPDYASVNLSEPDAPAVMDLLRKKGVGIEVGLATVGDAHRFVGLPDTDKVLRILIEIDIQELHAAYDVAEEIAAGHGRHPKTHPASRDRRNRLAIRRTRPQARLVDAGRARRRQASS